MRVAGYLFAAALALVGLALFGSTAGGIATPAGVVLMLAGAWLWAAIELCGVES